jgi:hypothetical protein
MQCPNHKFLAAEKIVETGGGELLRHDDDLVQLLYKRQEKLPYVENELSRALDLYERKRQSRYLLEAMLISPDGSTEKIVENMKVKKGVVENYSKYFFDTTVFADQFDLLDYISELTDEVERITKKMAVTEGYYYLLSHFSGGDLQVSPSEINKKMQAFSYAMVKQASGAMLRSDTAKEAKQWGTLLKSFNDSLSKSESGHQGDFLSEFLVILETGPATKKIDELPPDSVVQG